MLQPSQHVLLQLSKLKNTIAYGRILTNEEMVQRADMLRACGKRVVWTNGCFDLLHPGHFFLLDQASKNGDVLLVGIDNDESVKSKKGHLRPIYPEVLRALMVASINVVHAVTIFSANEIHSIVKQVKPDVIVKGEAQPGDMKVFEDDVSHYGGIVTVSTKLDGISTSLMIQAILDCGQED